MKIKLFVAVFFICSSIFSQIECKHFVGNWKVSKEDKVTNFITLEKDEKGYGTSIIINNKFEIRETFSAPCGNDTRFLKFAQKGIQVSIKGAASSSYSENEWWKSENGLIALNNEYIKLIYYFMKY